MLTITKYWAGSVFRPMQPVKFMTVMRDGLRLGLYGKVNYFLCRTSERGAQSAFQNM